MRPGVKSHRKRKQNELYHLHKSPVREIVVVEFLQEHPPKSANERLRFKSQHIFVSPRFLLSHSSTVGRGSRSRHRTSVLTQFESLLQVNSLFLLWKCRPASAKTQSGISESFVTPLLQMSDQQHHICEHAGSVYTTCTVEVGDPLLWHD